MTTKPDQAVATFNNGFNCAQAVFSTYAEEFGIDRTIALKISCGFGAGMGRRSRKLRTGPLGGPERRGIPDLRPEIPL